MKDKQLLILLVLTLIFFEEDDACTPSAAGSDGHALWLSNNTFPGSSTDFVFEQGAQFKKFPDGTAMLTYTTYNANNPSDQWQVVVYLADKKNWKEWSNAGRSYKDKKGIIGQEY